MNEPLLQVDGFSVTFDTFQGQVLAVRDVSFAVRPGEIVAIVGESGSGKSVMTQSLVKLLPSPPARVEGNVRLLGRAIDQFNFRQYKAVKGKEIAYIFQDPMTSLNPTLKIGRQVVEGILAHSTLSKSAARAKAIALLKEAGIPSPERRMEQYPHELSGGMRQRVMIAIAIAMEPKLLVADEPTTALDVTIQAQILTTLKGIVQKTGMAMLLITHDMGIVAGLAQRVLVMYGGKIVEAGDVLQIFENPHHPYTRALLQAVPRLDLDTVKPLETIVGTPPNMLSPPKGCPFAPRCRFAMHVCKDEMPAATPIQGGGECLCHLWANGAVAQRARYLAEAPVEVIS